MQRTTTPPPIKWLANEMAAIKGELARIDEEIAALMSRRQRQEVVLSALENVSRQMAAPGLVDLVPVVKAHEARYGGRGQLRSWLKATLQAAAPAALDTATLTEMAEAAFGLEFQTKQARLRFISNTLGRALRAMLDAGQVERIHNYTGVAYRAGVWRWTGGAAQSLGQLAAAAQEL